MGTRHWPPVTDRLKLATRYVHGELASPSDCGGSLLPELCLSTAFRYPSAEALQAVVSGEQTGDIYIPGSAAIRAFTPLERKLADLETTPATRVFGAGMGTLSTALLPFGGSGILLGQPVRWYL